MILGQNKTGWVRHRWRYRRVVRLGLGYLITAWLLLLGVHVWAGKMSILIGLYRLTRTDPGVLDPLITGFIVFVISGSLCVLMYTIVDDLAGVLCPSTPVRVWKTLEAAFGMIGVGALVWMQWMAWIGFFSFRPLPG